VPPIEGADSEGVFTLRTVEDADAIKEWASSSKRLVLIGGGLLGLEAGNGLRRAGLDVSVVEFFPRLLPRQMDVDGAAILQRQMEEMGFAFHLGAKTKSISRDGKELSVNLENGESIAADMVLISAGVRPELGLAKMIGLDIDKAVKVDDRMQTNVQDIFAAGDVAEHRGAYYGIWPPAMQQGQTAGANMAGEDRAYTGTVPANTLKVVGIDLTSAGNIDADSEREAAVIADSDKYIYRKIVFNNGLIEGAILLGDIRGSAEILMAMQSQKDVSSLKDDMKREDFDFSRLK
jgi:nitrite reductase (NADH) large subunit